MIDPWFLDQLSQVMEFQDGLAAKPLDQYTLDEIRISKEYGLSDRRLSFLTQVQRNLRFVIIANPQGSRLFISA